MMLRLPVPPSKNDAWEPKAITSKAEIVSAVKAVMDGEAGAWKLVMRALKVVVPKSKAYEAYLRQIAEDLKGQDTVLLDGEVAVSVKVFFRDRRRDMPNVIDVLLDSLEGVAYHNDRQVAVLGVVKMEPSATDPRVEVMVVRRPAGQSEMFTAIELREMEELEF